MKMVVAAIYTNFRTDVADDVHVEGRDGYSGGPQSDYLLIRLTGLRG